MAYAKSIPIYGEPVATLKYVSNKDKTNINLLPDEKQIFKTPNSSYLDNALNYISNTDKTDISLYENSSIVSSIKPDVNEMEFLTSGVHCWHESADLEFKLVRDKYYSIKDEGLTNGKKARTAYHIIQSFHPDEQIDPKLCHHIGRELTEELGHFQAVVSTHLDRDHMHNHIVINAFAYDGCYKYKDNKDAIANLRSINDKLAKKYGLSIIVNPDKARDSSYKEWLEKSRNNSWKEQIRCDIENVKNSSSSWLDFRDKMKSSGYTLRETKNTITYTMPGNPILKIRDKNLGRDFTKSSLMNFWILKEQESRFNSDSEFHVVTTHKKKNNYDDIYVSRYSDNGRRRSDLEIILILAIKTLKAVGDLFRDRTNNLPDTPIHKPLNWKLSIMEDSLNYSIKTGIENSEQLNDMIHNEGAALSHLKKCSKELNEKLLNKQYVLNLLKNKQALEEYIEKLNFNFDNFSIPTFTEPEIVNYQAEIFSITPSQRKELYLLLENSDTYHLVGKYDSLNYESAQSAIDFLNSKSNVCPEFILSSEDFELYRIGLKYKRIQEQRINDMKNKYSSKPLSDKQTTKLLSLGISSDCIDSLNFFDGITIINYLSKKNPFKDFFPPINVDPGKKPPKSLLNQLEELLILRNETIKGSVEDLSIDNAYVLYNYLINFDYVPDMYNTNLQSTESIDHDQIFIDSLSSYSLDEQKNLNDYRNILIELSKLGFTDNKIKSFIQDYDSISSQLRSNDSNMDICSQNYKDLKRLQYNLSLADNVHFRYGALYKEEESSSPTNISSLCKDDNHSTTLEDDSIEDNVLKTVRKSVYRENDTFFDNTH